MSSHHQGAGGYSTYGPPSGGSPGKQRPAVPSYYGGGQQQQQQPVATNPIAAGSAFYSQSPYQPQPQPAGPLGGTNSNNNNNNNTSMGRLQPYGAPPQSSSAAAPTPSGAAAASFGLPVCSMTRTELNEKLRESRYGENRLAFDCYFVREPGGGQHGSLPLCAVCRHPIGVHQDRAAASWGAGAEDDDTSCEPYGAASTSSPGRRRPPPRHASPADKRTNAAVVTATTTTTTAATFGAAHGAGTAAVVNNNDVAENLPTGVTVGPEGFRKTTHSRLRIMFGCITLFVGFMLLVTMAPNRALMGVAPYAIIPGVVIAAVGLLALLTVPIYRVFVDLPNPNIPAALRPVRITKTWAIAFGCTCQTIETTATAFRDGLRIEDTNVSVGSKGNRTLLHVLYVTVDGAQQVPLHTASNTECTAERNLWTALLERTH